MGKVDVDETIYKSYPQIKQIQREIAIAKAAINRAEKLRVYLAMDKVDADWV